MAPQFLPNPHPILLLLIISSTAVTATMASPNVAAFQSEIESMTEALRLHGSTLFTNAIATTDLQYQLFSSAASPRGFTIFVPKDSLLYALDMISDSSTYITTLRYHVIPHRRLSFLHLQTNLSSPFLQTLLPHYSLLVAKTRESDDILLPNTTSIPSPGVSVMVDGVRISSPDIFLGQTLAVHGIDGILVTGLNMYQDFDLDPPGTTTASNSGSSPPPSPPSPSVEFPPPPSAEYPSPPPINFYDSPVWPPAESPISSSVVIDEDGVDMGMDSPPFSDQDPMSYWDTNSNDWTANDDGDGNVMMMDYDGSREEAMKKIIVGKRRRMRKVIENNPVTESRRRLRGGHRHHLLDL